LDSDSDEHYMVMHRSWDGLDEWVPRVPKEAAAAPPCLPTEEWTAQGRG